MESTVCENVQPNRLPWYSKCYKHLRNRNRISPGKVVIADSEFIDTGPRRHLRIICPPVKDNMYYENAKRDMPQSVNDNFFSKWSRRPHPSGSCRCSYRRSNRLSTTEEQLICNEIQRIRTSLCEAEMNGQNIEEIEQSVYKNLENLRAASPIQSTKEKIARDLDKYINDLLEDILCNTAHVLSEMDPSANVRVNFSCYDKNDGTMQLNKDGGYVNAGFVGSKSDLDDLNNCSEPNVDYVDSGINSVETVELEAEQPSLEQSLMAIIDSKLGTNGLDKSIDNLHMEIAVFGDHSHESIHNDESGIRSLGISSSSVGDVGMLGHSFHKSRLELKDENEKTCKRNVAAKMTRTVSVIRKKLATSLSSKKNNEKTIKTVQDNRKLPLNDAVSVQSNRKPMIVFLHGFGSSADIFQHQLNYFSSIGYPCFAPDMLGHGFSSAPTRSKDYHFEKLLKDIDVILNHYALKPGHKCVLVGHNYGCSFATSLASKYDSQISQLILISGGGPTPLAPPNSEGVGRCLLRAVLAPLLVCGLHRDILYSARGRQHPYCVPGTQQEWPSHMKYVLKGMVWPNGDYAFHRRISTPTLLIHGLRDNSVSLVQECQMERTMIKALLEAIPTAGHSPMTDCPDQLNHMIHCFIDLWKNKK